MFHPPGKRSMGCLVVNATLSHAPRRLRGCLAQAGEATQSALPDGLAGCPARRPGHFSCFAKRSNQEKATPEMAVRCADCPRRWHRNREASETRFADSGRFFIRFRHQRRVAINGDPHCNGNGNGNRNGRCAELQATATVAARSLFDQPVRPNTL